MTRPRPEDLHLYSIPPGWAWACLEDTQSNAPNAMTDGPFGSKLKSAHYMPSGVRVIRLGNLGVGEFKWADEAYISEDHYGQLLKHEAFAGDLLIAALAEPVGRCCLVPEGLGRAIVKADCVRLEVHPRLNKALVMHWLNSPAGRKYCERLSHGVGRLRINMGNMRALPVPTPPLGEQRRIVAKIDALQERSAAAKEALDAIPPLLEKFRQSVLAAAFRGDLTREWRKQNPDVEPASKLLERIRVERRRRWIEERAGKTYKEPRLSSDPSALTADAFATPSELAWEAAPLEALVCPLRGIPYGIVKTGDPTAGGVPTVRCGDIREFNIDLRKLKLVSPSVNEQYQRTQLLGGEVLVAIRGTVGATAVATSEMEGMNISREVAMVPALPGIDSGYLMYVLASPAGQALMQGHVKGVAQSGINLRDLRPLPMPIPPAEEQVAIVHAVEAALDLTKSIEATVAELRRMGPTLNQSILAKAFRGELVPQDPDDEPASVLLDRIKAERAASEPTRKKRKARARPK